MIDEISVLHSNIDPNSLVCKGEHFAHLHRINNCKIKDLFDQLNLKSGLPTDEVIFFFVSSQ
jgi:hypothetical protein